jgi:Ca2+-binding RTX toxin-like protein
MTINGTAGNDNLAGTGGNDTFNLSQGGNDTATGKGGKDVFKLKGAFNALDSLNGGSGKDTLILEGDYVAGVTFLAGTMTGIESLRLVEGFDYTLTLDNANVAAGSGLTVNAKKLGAGDFLNFNGVAETNGHFKVVGGAAGDTIRLGQRDVLLASKIDGGSGGFDSLYLDGNYATQTQLDGVISNIDYLALSAGHDYNFVVADGTVPSGSSLQVEGGGLGAGDDLIVDASADTEGYYLLYGGAGDDNLKGSQFGSAFALGGGADTIQGGAGNDVVYAPIGLSANDIIHGGGGFNYIYAEAVAGLDVVFGADSLTNIVQITLAPHGVNNAAFSLTMHNANVKAGETLTIAADLLGATNVLTVDASAEGNGRYIIVGGAADDVLTGGLLGDNLTGGGGADTFRYSGPAWSTSTTRDTIGGFNADADKFDLNVSVGNVSSVSHAISAASFDADMGAALTDFVGAALVTADGGDLIGHVYLVVVADGDFSYDAGTDYVFEVTGFTGTFDTGDFI